MCNIFVVKVSSLAMINFFSWNKKRAMKEFLLGCLPSENNSGKSLLSFEIILHLTRVELFICRTRLMYPV